MASQALARLPSEVMPVRAHHSVLASELGKGQVRARSEPSETLVTRGPHLQRANTEPCEVQTRETAKKMIKTQEDSQHLDSRGDGGGTFSYSPARPGLGLSQLC